MVVLPLENRKSGARSSWTATNTYYRPPFTHTHLIFFIWGKKMGSKKKKWAKKEKMGHKKWTKKENKTGTNALLPHLIYFISPKIRPKQKRKKDQKRKKLMLPPVHILLFFLSLSYRHQHLQRQTLAWAPIYWSYVYSQDMFLVLFSNTKHGKQKVSSPFPRPSRDTQNLVLSELSFAKS